MSSPNPLDLAFPDQESSSSGTDSSSNDDLLDKAFGYNPSWSDAFKGVGKMFVGGAEGIAHAATGTVGALGGGLNYLGTLAATRDPEAAKAVQEATQSALTYQPRTAEGKASASAVDTAASYLGPKEGEAAGPWVADKATALGASPQLAGGLGAAANTGIQAIPYALGVAKGLRGPVEEDAPTVRIEPTLEPRTSGSSVSVSDQILSDSRKAGYVVPPATSNPNLFNRAVEGFAGKANVAQAASIKNQAITDGLARTALKLSADAPLTADAMADVRAPAGRVYEQVKGSGPITVDPQYHSDLDALTKTSSTIQKDLPKYASGAQAQIKNLTDSLRPENGQIDSETAVELSKDLRYNAASNYSAANRTGDPSLKALGSAQQKAAAAVEDQVGRHLTSIGQPELSDSWDDARATIAKSYSVQNALDGAGHVDATKLGKQLLKGKPLSDELETAANFANAFPKAARVLPGKESMPGMSPLDVYGSVAASLAAGNPTPMLLGPGRMAARHMALSSLLQKAPD